jgi:uncharacterized membrane protein
MIAAIKFIKTTIIGGVVVIIPIAIIFVVLADAYQQLITATAPLTEKMPFGPFTNAILATLIITLIIAIIFFIAGMLLNTFWGKNIHKWVDKNFFQRIPMFSTLQELTERVAGIENSNFPVVEIDLYGTGNKMLGLVVETLPDGRLMVFTPSSPVITVGQLFIVNKDAIKILDASIADTIECISRMGLGAERIFVQSQ